MNNKTLGIVVLILVVLGLVIYATMGDRDMKEVNTADNTQGSFLNGSADNDTVGSVESNNNGNGSQKLTNNVTLSPVESGSRVNVASATLNKPGYVVIYQVKSNNKTTVIGTSELLLPGTYTDLTIETDAITAYKQSVIAVLHEDDGDGQFEFPNSDFYLGNSNQAIVSDVDVVGVDSEDENVVLQEKVEFFLSENEDGFETNSTSEQNN